MSDAVLEMNCGDSAIRDDDAFDDGLDECFHDLAVNRSDEAGWIITVALHKLVDHDKVACLFDERFITEKRIVRFFTEFFQPCINSCQVIDQLLTLDDEVLLWNVLFGVQEEGFQTTERELFP